MGATTDFMVAIELGSTRITGVAGQKNNEGGLTILAYASEDASTCIRKGVIFNIDKTAGAITSIINKLEASLDASIAKVYVGISGQSVRTVRNCVSKHLDEDTRITPDIVDELIALNRATQTGDMEILEIIPQEYRLGAGLQKDPIGVITNHIEGRFLNVVARSSVRRKIEECFALAKTKIAGYFIAPIEMARVVLTDAEFRSGCALIDFGAETTTVQVYKDHILRHLVVLPLGGNNINKDICSLKIEEADAEELKIKYASAFTEPQEIDAKPITYTYGTDNSTITDRLLCEITEARMEEIIANVWHQINLSEYADKLMAGIIVTGGASAIRRLGNAITANTKIEKIRTASYINLEVESVTPELLSRNGRSGTLLGLLYAARENCCEQEPLKDLFEEETDRLEKETLLEQQKAEAARIAREKAEQEEAERKAEEERIAREKAEQEEAEREAERQRLEAERKAKEEEARRIRRENSLFHRLKVYGTQIVKDILDDDDDKKN